MSKTQAVNEYRAARLVADIEAARLAVATRDECPAQAAVTALRERCGRVVREAADR